jgi:hypothetical protein
MSMRAANLGMMLAVKSFFALGAKLNRKPRCKSRLKFIKLLQLAH